MNDRAIGSFGAQGEHYDYSSQALAAIEQRVEHGTTMIGCIEAAASILQRGMYSAEVSGRDAGLFPAEVRGSIMRSLVTQGQYAGIRDNGGSLIEIFDYEVIGNGADRRIRYKSDGGKITTDQALHVRFSVRPKGEGAGILQNAQMLYQAASKLEQALAYEMSTDISALIPMPKPDDTRLAALKAEIKNAKGGLVFVQTTQGNAMGAGAPNRDYEMRRTGPRLQPEMNQAAKMIENLIFKALGVLPIAWSDVQSISRESLRLSVGTLDGYGHLISDAANAKGFQIEFSFNRYRRIFDLGQMTRAAKMMAESDGLEFTSDEIKERTGLA